jgi:hypothetical protein
MRSCEHKLDVWVTQHGEEIKFCNLETGHLLNIVAMLHRRDDCPQRNKLISLHKEVVKRLQDW